MECTFFQPISHVPSKKRKKKKRRGKHNLSRQWCSSSYKVQCDWLDTQEQNTKQQLLLFEIEAASIYF